MNDEKAVEKIRGRHLALQNERQEAMARPGKSETAVVISRATLDYYKGLEALLEDALELAISNHPPIIEINAQAIGEAMTAAAVNAIAEVTGLQVPVPREGVSDVEWADLPPISENGRLFISEPKPVTDKEATWLPIDEAVQRAGIDLGPAMSAVYGGKIKKRGRGKTLEVNAASFRRWVEAYKQRTGK